MNKKILTIAILTIMVAMTAPAFALTVNTSIPSTPLSNIPTAANSVSSNTSSAKPMVTAKAEWISGTWDDDSAKPWLQVNPASGFNASKTLYYMVVAEGSNGAVGSLPGRNDLPAAFADVTHPDGTPKYQVVMPNVISCEDSDPATIMQWINNLNTLASKNLITFAGNQTIADVTDALYECSAKLYYGTADINNCQMCGQFTWESHCEGTTPCQTVWNATDMTDGYKVDAYVFDKGGAMSNVLTNHFEFICQAGIETDFTSLNYENVTYNVHKWIQGNKIWDPKGPACESGINCIKPSIRNIGNIPVNLTVLQNDMGFGQSTGGWNVKWDARLGEINEHATVEYDPFVTTAIPGGLDICQLDKISFSILPKKAQDLGPRNGTITITPNPVPFPWWE